MHPIDRFLLQHRRAIAILGIVAVIPALVSFLGMIKLAFLHWPIWAVALSVLSFCIMAVSVGLPDFDRSESRKRSTPGQSGQLPRS